MTAPAGKKDRLLYVVEVMLVAEVLVYWNVDVEAVNVPCFTNGVPEPERVHILEPASRVWRVKIVKTFKTVIPPEPVEVIVVTPESWNFKS